MRDNKEYLMIEKEVWESVCSRVAALSQKIRVYEQSHQPAPDYYNNKEVRELLGVDDKIIRKYRDRGLLGYIVVGDKFWYSQGDIKDFLNRNRHEAFAK